MDSIKCDEVDDKMLRISEFVNTKSKINKRLYEYGNNNRSMVSQEPVSSLLDEITNSVNLLQSADEKKYDNYSHISLDRSITKTFTTFDEIESMKEPVSSSIMKTSNIFQTQIGVSDTQLIAFAEIAENMIPEVYSDHEKSSPTHKCVLENVEVYPKNVPRRQNSHVQFSNLVKEPYYLDDGPLGKLDDCELSFKNTKIYKKKQSNESDKRNSDNFDGRDISNSKIDNFECSFDLKSISGEVLSNTKTVNMDSNTNLAITDSNNSEIKDKDFLVCVGMNDKANLKANNVLKSFHCENDSNIDSDPVRSSNDNLNTFLQSNNKNEFCNFNINAKLGSKQCTNVEDKSFVRPFMECHNSDFKGFTTASDKIICLSENALILSKKIFSEINYDISNENINSNLTEISKNSCEQLTECGKTNERIDESLYLTNNLFKRSESYLFQSNDELVEINDMKSNMPSDVDKKIQRIMKNPNEISFTGFSTASKKLVKISERSLEKVNDIFKGIDDNFIGHINEKNVMNINYDRNHKDSVQEHKDRHSDSIEDNGFIRRKNSEKGDIKNVLKHQVCETKNSNICGNITGVSDMGMLKNNSMFDHVENKHIDEVKNNFVGFTTASNKMVSVSEKSLEYVSNIFNAVDAEFSKKDEVDFNKHYMKKDTLNYNATEKANILNTSLCDDGSSAGTVKRGNESFFNGFTTACNNTINVSENALLATKNIFTDLKFDLSNKHIISNISINVKNPFNSYDRIDDINEVIDQTDKIFKNIDSNLLKPKDLINKTNNDIFNLCISDNEGDEACEMPIKKSCINNFKGFTTASNKFVDVSEKALQQVSNIFNGINNNLVRNEDSMALKSNDVSEKTRKKCDSSPVALNTKIDTEVGSKLHGQLQESKKKITKSSDYMKIIKNDVIQMTAESKCTVSTNLKRIPECSVINENRCTSPILSQPKVKRRCAFKTPYSNEKKSKQSISICVDSQTDQKSEIQIENVYERKLSSLEKKMSLKEMKALEVSNAHLPVEVHQDIFSLNLERPHTFLNFEFRSCRNDVSKGKVSFSNIQAIFENSPCVDQTLIPNGWVKNHFKWIVWKLASYEVAFARVLGQSGALTVRTVLTQLRLRYERELIRAQRSILRAILEGDAAPATPMVLLVTHVNPLQRQSVGEAGGCGDAELEVCDGWYGVRARLAGGALARLRVGDKLRVRGARLLNCPQPVSPLEEGAEDVVLQLWGNSCARARWDARLGAGRPPRLRLLDLRARAGSAASTIVTLARLYPPLYIERLPDGSTVSRGERAEQEHELQCEGRLQELLAGACEDVQRRLQARPDPCLEAGCAIAGTSAGSESAGAHECASLREQLLADAQEEVRRRMEPHTRKVVRVLKMHVMASGAAALLSVWPAAAVEDGALVEGAALTLHCITPTARSMGELQMLGGRGSAVMRRGARAGLDEVPERAPADLACPRPAHPLLPYVDLVGLITRIQDDPRGAYQDMYLSDASGTEACVQWWGGLRAWGVARVAVAGACVCVCDVRVRATPRATCVRARATELSSVTCEPRAPRLREALRALRDAVASNRPPTQGFTEGFDYSPPLSLE